MEANDGSVVFADDAARALLAGCVASLSRPDAEQWEMVKSNPSRTVWRGSISGQRLYIKHFHGTSITHRLSRALGRRRAVQEMRFAMLLSQASVETAPVLAVGFGEAREWIVTAAVEPAVAGDAWHRQMLCGDAAGQRRIRQATGQLAEMVARMHSAGLVHRDLHCGNLLVLEGPQPRLVLMDLHRTAVCRRLTRHQRAANIAQLMHDRLDCTTRAERLRFLKRYLAASGCGGGIRVWQGLIGRLAQRHRQRQFARNDKRTMRSNRYFLPIALSGGWRGQVMLESRKPAFATPATQARFTLDDWKNSLGDVERLFAGGATVVKDSQSGLVVRRKLNVGACELDVFIKRPRRKKPYKTIIDCFRPARALKAFALGHSLLNRQIPTALPLAFLQRRVGPFLVDSILITETVPGMRLDEFLSSLLARVARPTKVTAAQHRQLAQQVLGQMGKMLQRLHDNNFAHRDLKETNMIVRWEAQRDPQVVLLDLDGLKKCRRITTRRRFQGLMRLNVSLLRCPPVNHAGRLRMLLGYLRRPGSGRINFKPYWRILEQWSARKLKQQINSQRKRQKAIRR